jgi:hypothetical protein
MVNTNRPSSPSPPPEERETRLLDWSLELLWDLELGIWIFHPSLALRFNSFGIDLDFYFVPDNRRARLGSRIVADPKSFAAQFCFRVETDASATPGISNWAAELNRERDFFGHSVHREVANQNGFVALLFRLFADKSDCRIFLRIKEIRRAKMVITLGDARIDAFNLDRALGFLDRVVVHHHGTFEFVEFTMDVVNDEMADRKAYPGMVGIKIVSVSRESANREQ